MKAEMKTKAFESLMVYLVIRSTDQTKSWVTLKESNSIAFLRNQLHHKTIHIATDVLANHKINPKCYQNQMYQHGKAAMIPVLFTTDDMLLLCQNIS